MEITTNHAAKVQEKRKPQLVPAKWEDMQLSQDIVLNVLLNRRFEIKHDLFAIFKCHNPNADTIYRSKAFDEVKSKEDWIPPGLTFSNYVHHLISITDHTLCRFGKESAISATELAVKTLQVANPKTDTIKATSLIEELIYIDRQVFTRVHKDHLPSLITDQLPEYLRSNMSRARSAVGSSPAKPLSMLTGNNS